MRFKTILAAVSAAALAAAPTAAIAGNPAASLSVASSARASAEAGDSKFIGGGWLPVIILGVVAVASIVALTSDDDPSSP